MNNPTSPKKKCLRGMALFLLAIGCIGNLPQTCLGALLLSGGGSHNLSVWTSDNITSGFRFTTQSRLVVTDLGILDVDVFDTSGSNGLFEDHMVGLWSESGALLAETTVAAGTVDPLINGYRFSSLATAIEIGPGTYWLGAHYQTQNSNVNAADMWRWIAATEVSQLTPSWATVDARGVTLGYASPGTGSFIEDGDAYAGPNLIARAVPEPSTVTSFVLIAGLFAIRRKRRSLIPATAVERSF